MTDAALRAQYVAELSLIEATLRELGYDTTLDEHADPTPMLAAELGDDGSGDQRTMIVTIESEGLFADREDVHFTIVLPFDVPADRADDVERAIPIVNTSVATGHFELAGSSVAYEHVLTVGASATVSDDELRRLVPTLVDEQERYGDYLQGVADDEISVAVLADVIAAGD